MTTYKINRLIELKTPSFIHPKQTIVEKQFIRPSQKDRVYQICTVGKDLIKDFPECQGIKKVFIKRDSNDAIGLQQEYKNHTTIFNACSSVHIPVCLGYKNNTIVYEYIKSINPLDHFNTIKEAINSKKKLNQLKDMLTKLYKVYDFIKSIHLKGYIHNDLFCFFENCLFTDCKREFVIVDFENMYKITPSLHAQQEFDSLLICIKDVETEIEKVRRLPATSQD